ncbi:ABC transporter substrate-binding protein [Martelella alba]|uniref:ABC transporter substrate-binding protein n=2 Tax=Martelella alba TaxID=2590451 RepID=A0A506UGD6_9HYPH|nr:ABC transporter substrate-binding protein [Martelella alba]
MMRKILLAACTAALLAGSAIPTLAEKVTWSYSADVSTLDPYALDQTFNLGVLGNVYEGLIERGPHMEIQPALATSWEIVDPKRWRFHLRQGVTFQDGQPFTADDVVFSVERSLSEGSLIKSSKMHSVVGAEKVDDYTVDILLSEPNPILINDWGNWYIMSKSWADEHGVKADPSAEDIQHSYASTHANGTGPYKITDREPDSKTVAVRNDGWWGDATNNVTEVEFRPIGSNATRTAALLSGEIDLAVPVPLQDQQRIEDAPGVRLLAGPELRVVFVGMDVDPAPLPGSDTDANPLSSRDVREAVYRAINVDAIQRVIMRGKAIPTAAMVPQEFHGFPKDMTRFPYDLDKAKELLASAGYADGFSTTMECPNNRYVNDEAICTAIVGMLAKVGITVSLDAMPVSQLVTSLADTSRRRGLWFLGLSPGNIDANGLMQESVHTRTGSWGTWNAGHLNDTKLDAIIEASVSESDPAKRDALLAQSQQIVHDQVYFIPIHQQTLSWGVSDKLDVVQRPDDVFVWKYANVKD